MEDEFDVLIVGAGIAGSLCARELCKKKKKVILVEKQQNYPVSKDTLMTLRKYIKKFGLSKKVVLNNPHRLTYRTYPELDSSSFSDKQVGVRAIILDCNKFISDNIKSALGNGCVFKINEELNGIKKQDDGYECSLKNEDYSFKARIIIDASGISCSVSKIFGCHNQRGPEAYCNNFLTAGDNIKNTGDAFFDLDTLNRCFWIYPISHNRSYAGLIALKKENFRDFVNDLEKYLKVHSHEYIKHYNEEYGCNYYNNFSPIKNKKIVVDNILFIGEAGGTTTPLLGEGFRPISECVLWLSKNIDKVLSGETKLEELHDYFFSTVGKDYPIMRAVLPFIAMLNHKQSCEIMNRHLLKLTPKKLYQFSLVSQKDEEWRDLALSIAGTLSIYDKIKFAVMNPVKAINALSVLKKRGIIKSASELF